MLFTDLLSTEMPEGLDDRTTDPARCRHVSSGRVFQDDLLAADPDVAGRAVCEEDDSGRNLFGQPQQIRGITTRRLQARGVAFGHGFRDPIRARGKEADDRVLVGVVVKPTGQTAENAAFLQAVQCNTYRFRAAKIEKCFGSVYRINRFFEIAERIHHNTPVELNSYFTSQL